jgi:hypothetical protein
LALFILRILGASSQVLPAPQCGTVRKKQVHQYGPWAETGTLPAGLPPACFNVIKTYQAPSDGVQGTLDYPQTPQGYQIKAGGHNSQRVRTRGRLEGIMAGMPDEAGRKGACYVFGQQATGCLVSQSRPGVKGMPFGRRHR